MKIQLGKGLATAAAAGIVLGLTGCGGSAQPAAPPTAAPAHDVEEKNGCPGKPGEKHVCGAGHRHDGGQPAPAATTTSDPTR